MKKGKKQSGSTAEQLTLPGMELRSYSADSGGSRHTLGKNTYDPSWEVQKK